jgi:uncharacterized protein YecE (DUF72 family)
MEMLAGTSGYSYKEWLGQWIAESKSCLRVHHLELPFVDQPHDALQLACPGNRAG